MQGTGLMFIESPRRGANENKVLPTFEMAAESALMRDGDESPMTLASGDSVSVLGSTCMRGS